MKFNFAYPHTGLQKQIEFNDEKKLKVLNDMRLAQLVELDFLGDEWKGYIAKIISGSDKDGFAMKQGVLTTGRVRLLLKAGSKCFQSWKRKGSVLCMKIVRKGENEIPGLTDSIKPRPLGPKRASKIRKMFNLSKKDDVRQYVIRSMKPSRPNRKDGSVRSVTPKIQRLITPERLQRKRKLRALRRKRFEKSRASKQDYLRLLAKIRRERAEARRSSRSSTRVSQSSR